MSSLNLVIPGLFWPDLGDLDYINQRLKPKYLNKISLNAKLSNSQYSFSDFILATDTFYNNSLANYYANNMGLTGFNTYLLAQPCNLRLDRDRLLISEPELLQLQPKEALALINLINHEFNAEFELFLIHDNLWLCGIKKALNLTTYLPPIIDIVGEDISNYLVTANLDLVKLINQLQTFLHLIVKPNHTKKPIINNLWLWDKTPSNLKFNNLISQPLNLKAFNSHNFYLIDKLYYPAQYRDLEAWFNLILELDYNLFKPLLFKLQHFSLTKLNLWIPALKESKLYQLNSWQSLKFW